MATTPAATPPLLRRVNAGKLLGVLSTAGVMTGTGLIEATGLTRATVHAVCNDLIGMGWVVELDPGHDAPGTPVGRPSRRFEFNSQAGYVLGIDVGAAKTTVLLSDLRGETVAKSGRSFQDVKTPAEQTEVVNQAVLEVLASAEVTDAEVLAAGVGVAAPVDREGNILVDDEFWRRFDAGLTSKLTELHGWPVLLENDANLAALGEHWRGEARDVDDLVVLLAGERFGSGLDGLRPVAARKPRRRRRDGLSEARRGRRRYRRYRPDRPRTRRRGGGRSAREDQPAHPGGDGTGDRRDGLRRGRRRR